MLISLAPIFESIVAWFENSDDINSFSGSFVYKQHNKNGSIKMFFNFYLVAPRPPTRCWSLHFYIFDPEFTGSLVMKLGLEVWPNA